MFRKKPELKKVRRSYVPDFTVEWCENGYKGYINLSVFDLYYTPLYTTKKEVIEHIYRESCEKHVKDMMNSVEGYSYE